MFSPCARKEAGVGGRPSERNSVCDMGKQEQYPMTCGGVTTISLKLKLYSVVKKNSSMFEFAAFLLPTNLGQPMHSPSALTEHVSLNLA